MKNRREFLLQTVASGLAAGSRSFAAAGRKRVFVAAFMHETNTFHPVKTVEYDYTEANREFVDAWKGANLEVVPGPVVEAVGRVGDVEGSEWWREPPAEESGRVHPLVPHVEPADDPEAAAGREVSCR